MSHKICGEKGNLTPWESLPDQMKTEQNRVVIDALHKYMEGHIDYGDGDARKNERGRIHADLLFLLDLALIESAYNGAIKAGETPEKAASTAHRISTWLETNLMHMATMQPTLPRVGNMGRPYPPQMVRRWVEKLLAAAAMLCIGSGIDPGTLTPPEILP